MAKTVIKYAIKPVDDYLDRVYRKSNSDSSRDNAQTSLKAFTLFCKKAYKSDLSRVIEKIRSGKLSVYDVLDKFVGHLNKEGLKPRSIRLRVNYARGYMVFNGVEINPYTYKVNITLPRITREKRQALTHEVVSRILDVMPLKLKVLILLEISTMRRPKELVSLRVKDIDFNSHPPMITIDGDISKNGTENHTFLTQECKRTLIAYLGDRIDDPDAVLFPANAKPIRIVKELTNLFRYHMKELPALNTKKEKTENRYNIPLYTFKDFGFTRVQKKIDVEFAKELKGDRTTEYSNATLEEKKAMFLDCEHDLTISGIIKKELEEGYSNQAKEIEELKRQREGDKDLRKEIESLRMEVYGFKQEQEFRRLLHWVWSQIEANDWPKEEWADFYNQPKIRRWLTLNWSRIKSLATRRLEVHGESLRKELRVNLEKDLTTLLNNPYDLHWIVGDAYDELALQTLDLKMGEFDEVPKELEDWRYRE